MKDLGKNNMYSRHNNKRALEKKERAKAKHFSSRQDLVEANDFVTDTKDVTAALVVGVKNAIIDVLFNGRVQQAKLATSLPFELNKDIVVGDKVLVEDVGEHLAILQRLKRTAYIARLRKDNTRFTGKAEVHVLAANVDVGVIVASVDDPPFSSALVDRYLILCEYGNVRPLLCLTKTDLSPETPAIVQYYRDTIGIEVVETSSNLGKGILELGDKLHQKVAVLLGKSGVGKSTLINSLNPSFDIRTSDISHKSREGRHTTTASQVYTWSENSFIIDTPGIRALNVDHILANDVQYYFPEFDTHRETCRYNDCQHFHEPECGVKEAVALGEIEAKRYESYIKLLEAAE